MFTEKERIDAVRDLNMMNERIDLSEKIIKDAEERLEGMKKNHEEMVQLRDLYATILNLVGGDQ